MVRGVANILSVVFHPVFILTYLLLILMTVNPYLFSHLDAKQGKLVVISVVALSVGFPLLTISLLKPLGLISSFKMEDRMERIGPLVATGIFYLWLFINIRNNPIFPEPFVVMVLGVTISLFVAFFFNNLTKISLHSIGMGGFVTAIGILRFLYSYDHFVLDLYLIGTFKVNVDLLFFASILLAGIIGSCRLVLNAHKEAEIYAGYLIGFLSQIIALRIIT